MSKKASSPDPSGFPGIPGILRIGGELFIKLFEKQENYALIVTNEKGIISNWNTGASKIFKYTGEEATGRHVSFLYSRSEKESDTPEKEFEKVIAQGEGESTLLFSGKDGSNFYVKCFLFPIEDEQNYVKGYIKVIQTLHDPAKNPDTQEFLKKIDQALTLSLDYNLILKQVINLCVPAIADWVYVDQLQKDGSSKRIEVIHADPAKVKLAEETKKFTAVADALNYPQARAQYKSRSILIPKITDEIIHKSAQNGDHKRIMKEINPNSLIAIPLIARGKTLGTLTFMVGESGRTYSKKDLKLAEEVARRTSLVLDNALLYEQARWERNRLQSVFTGAPVAIGIVSGPEYILEMANAPICEIWGRKAEDLLNKPVFKAIPEAEEQGFKAILDKVRATGDPFVGKEVPVNLNRGGKMELLYLNFVYQPVPDAEGSIDIIMAVAIDVSEQVQARKRVEESEKNLQIALDAGSMGTWHLNLENDISSRSLQHDQIFGYSSLLPKWGFKEFHSHILPADREMVANKFKEAMSTGHLSFEARIINAQNELRWIAVQGQVFYRNNEAVNMAGVVTDVTELYVARQEAQENAERFKMLLETIPQMTWTHKQDGSVTFFNQQWYNYTGLTKQQSLGLGWKEAIHPDDLPYSITMVSDARQTEQPFEMESRFRRGSDGMYRWQLVRALPVRNESGEVFLWVGTATDIHDQKMQSSLLQKQNIQLDEINKYLDNFVHTVAHDLRSPVANIIGLLSLLNLNGEDARNVVVAEKLKTSVERLDNTLKGMIKLIEIQSNSETNTELLFLQEIFEEVSKEYAGELHEIEHTINCELEHCPPLRFIKPFMESIFRNLISNSIKYRREGEPLEITVSCRKEDDFIILRFRDNGIGIDLKKHGKNLFKPFVRFTQQASGKGIGLHIINNMLQRHGGKVEVNSSLHTGTTFELYLKQEMGGATDN